MRRAALLFSAITLLGTGCGDDSGSSDESFDEPEDATSFEGTVVVFSPGDVEVDVMGNELTWTPTADEIAAAEDGLQEYIDEVPELGVDDLDTYVRQYSGVGDSIRFITVNALCDVGDEDPEEDFLAASASGPCYWDALVNVDGSVNQFNVD